MTNSAVRPVALFLIVIGLIASACAPASVQPVTADTIALGLNPSKKALKPGDEVVIAVTSDEWRAGELTWSLESKDLPSAPGKLSATQGAVVIYTAPDGPGNVTITVNGTLKGKSGRGSVSFNVLKP